MIDRTNLPLLVTLALGVFAGALDLGVLSPALPALAHTFAIPGRDVAWVFTLYLFANVVSIPVMTKLSDVYGRRPIYIACVATFVAGSVLAIAAPTFAVFLVARAIQAAGAGGIFPVAAAAIADRVPLEPARVCARVARRRVGTGGDRRSNLRWSRDPFCLVAVDLRGECAPRAHRHRSITLARTGGRRADAGSARRCRPRFTCIRTGGRHDRANPARCRCADARQQRADARCGRGRADRFRGPDPRRAGRARARDLACAVWYQATGGNVHARGADRHARRRALLRAGGPRRPPAPLLRSGRNRCGHRCGRLRRRHAARRTGA